MFAALMCVALVSVGTSTSTSAQSAPPDAAKAEAPAPGSGSEVEVSNDVALPAAGRSDTLVVIEPSPSGVVVLTSQGGSLRPTVTLAVKGMPSRLWTGYSCTTGSGRFAAVTFAPSEFVNDDVLRDRGAFLAVVDVEAGTARVVPERVALKYHTPGCGPTDEIAAVRTTADGATEVLRIDASKAAASSQAIVARHLTSPAPVGTSTYLAAERDLVLVGPGPAPATVASGDGELVDLTATSGGGVQVLAIKGDRATMHTVAAGGRTLGKAVAEGGSDNMRLERGPGGAARLVGSPSSSDRSVALLRTPHPVNATSLDGTVTVEPTTEPDVAGPQADDPVARSITLRGVTSGATSEATVSLAAPMVETLAVADTTNPKCFVAPMDYHVQVQQPSPEQVEWAVHKAVRGELTATVPANFVTSAFSPQGVFPRPALTGGGRIPAQVVLGVLAQESNLWQAAKGALPGLAADPIISSYYGTVYSDGRIVGFNYEKADCGYGVGQITTGMAISETTPYNANQKVLIATNYQANIAAVVQVLADKWNTAARLGIPVNSGSSAVVENWYVAMWAYNTGFYEAPNDGVGWTNNPANSDWRFNRKPYLRVGLDDALTPGDWAYEERVMGYAETGLYLYGERAFKPVTGSLKLPVLSNGQVDRFTFCTIAANNCNPAFSSPGGTPVPGDQSFCQDTSPNRACHWGVPVTWTTDPGTTEEASEYSSGGEPSVENPYPPSCTADASTYAFGALRAMPAGAKIVDDVPDMKWNLVGCGAKPSDGSFAFSYFTDTNGVSMGKIDTHQIGVGYGGHAYYSHSIYAGRPGNRVTGTWTAPTTSTGWQRIMVHIPANGAETNQADYTITAGTGSTFHRVVNQRWNEDTWIDLGVFSLAAGAKVSLSNVMMDEDAALTREVDVSWDAIAFVPSVKPVVSMVSFGDSYTAGEGDEPYQPDSDNGADTDGFSNSCHRSTQAYPAVAYRQLSSGIEASTTFHSSACSGAVMNDVAGDLIAGGQDRFSMGEIPQMKQGWLDSNTTLVTVGITGNDARFSDALANCAGTTCSEPGYVMAGDPDTLRTTEAAIIDKQQKRISDMVDEIHGRAPNAKIVLVGYPHVIGGVSFPSCPFNEGAVPMFAELGDRLNTVISQVACDKSASFVSLAHVYQGHEACTSDEWINGLVVASESGSGINVPGRGSYHPKGVGHSSAGPEVARVAKSTSPIAYAPFATLDAAIKQQFVDFAGRQPAANELTAWRNGITAKTESLDDLVVSLSKAPAWSDDRANLVRLYWAYFQRVPDLSGFNYWLGKLQDGSKTLTQVSATYAASSEFINKYGDLENDEFVTQIYNNIYERGPDPSGLAYWTGKLDRKEKTRGQVMLAFSDASEGIRRLQARVDTVLIHLGLVRAMPARAVVDAWNEGIPEGVPLEGNTRNLRLAARYDQLH